LSGGFGYEGSEKHPFLGDNNQGEAMRVSTTKLRVFAVIEKNG